MVVFVLAVLGLIVVALVAAVAVAGAIALRNKSSFERDAKLAPGLSTSAPTSWAGSHDPEARLHRRLRDAIAALSANQAFDHDGTLLDLRVELEQQAMALDEQLVATAALPLHVRGEPLEQIASAVGVIEQAIADLAVSSTGEAAVRLDTALDDIRTRTGLVAQARAALDALPPETEASTPEAGPGAPPTTSPPAASPPATGQPPTTPPSTP